MSKFKKPKCRNCRHHIYQKRKNGKIYHCQVYHRDIPNGGALEMSWWCDNKHEFIKEVLDERKR